MSQNNQTTSRILVGKTSASKKCWPMFCQIQNHCQTSIHTVYTVYIHILRFILNLFVLRTNKILDKKSQMQ